MVNLILRVLDGVLCRRHLIHVLRLEVYGPGAASAPFSSFGLMRVLSGASRVASSPIHVLQLEAGAVRRASFSPWRLEIARSNGLPLGSTIVLWALLVLLAGADRGVVSDLVAAACFAAR